jgi:hypothetical protein
MEPAEPTQCWPPKHQHCGQFAGKAWRFKRSEFQARAKARAKVEAATFDTLADVEVVDPARI